MHPSSKDHCPLYCLPEAPKQLTKNDKSQGEVTALFGSFFEILFIWKGCRITANVTIIQEAPISSSPSFTQWSASHNYTERTLAQGCCPHQWL